VRAASTAQRHTPQQKYNVIATARGLTVAMPASTPSSTTSLQLTLPIADCEACRRAVVDLLAQIDGVVDAHVDLELRTASVDFRPELTTPALIRRALAEAGYLPVDGG
jgi:copper chaperone CopZ